MFAQMWNDGFAWQGRVQEVPAGSCARGVEVDQTQVARQDAGCETSSIIKNETAPGGRERLQSIGEP